MQVVALGGERNRVSGAEYSLDQLFRETPRAVALLMHVVVSR